MLFVSETSFTSLPVYTNGLETNNLQNALYVRPHACMWHFGEQCPNQQHLCRILHTPNLKGISLDWKDQAVIAI